MSEFVVELDGRRVTVREGTTVLGAARQAGVFIPTLCRREELAPYGGCRLCLVESEGRGGRKLVASCVHPVEEDLVVRTRSGKIDRLRKLLLELFLAHAPEAAVLRELGREYGADATRFVGEGSFCVHCGLCVRYCAQVEKKDAVGFVERGTKKEIAFVPEIASRECAACKRCFPLCPTSYLQAAYVLIQGLAFPAGC
ncbi:MAG: (2Fe-2S)-binding protein [Deltaproteobacteria bacterium]|nr:(2Fe-2S)-binding protein [Deltaproteobacteria bacterium]